MISGKGGCVASSAGQRVRFDGDASALAALDEVPPVVPELRWPALLGMSGALAVVLVARRRREPLATSCGSTDRHASVRTGVPTTPPSPPRTTVATHGANATCCGVALAPTTVTPVVPEPPEAATAARWPDSSAPPP